MVRIARFVVAISVSLLACGPGPHRGDYDASPSARGLEAPNRAHAFRTLFTPDGIRVEDSADSTHELFRLRLSAVGRGDDLPSVSPGRVVRDASRVEVVRPGLVEWYENSPRGLEQGFTIAERPAGHGPLVLELALEGADAAWQGDRVVLRTESGRRFDYGALETRDVRDRIVPSRFEVAASHLIQLHVEDRDAIYPIVVDPLLSGTAGESLRSDQPGSQFGAGLASVGDVNGDGYDDVAISAPGYDSGEDAEGAVFLFHGGPGGLEAKWPADADTRIESDQERAAIGYHIAGAGDVNGDGFDDVIIGWPFYADGEANEGAAFLFYGGPDGITSGNLASASVMLESNVAGARFGTSVDGAGDVNGDGFDDIVVGASDGVYVFHGGESGVAGDVSAAGGRVTGVAGAYAIGAGDLNRDGFGDVALGDPGYTNGESGEGGVFVFLGSGAGIGHRSVEETDARFESNQAGSEFGRSLASAGDVDRDGFDDLVVGAPGFDDSGNLEAGAAFVFRGRSELPAAGTLLDAATTLLPESGAHRSFGSWVEGLGDLDRDGYDDVAVGDPGMARFHLYLGRREGIPSLRADRASVTFRHPDHGTSSAGLGRAVAAGDLDGDGFEDALVVDQFMGSLPGIVHILPGGRGIRTAEIFLPTGSAFSPLFAVDSAGDVDGDGFDDILLGHSNNDSGPDPLGAFYVYRGGPDGVSGGGPDEADTILGADDPIGCCADVAGLGDVNGDGFDDIAVTNTDAVLIFYGGAGGIASGPLANADVRLDFGAQFGDRLFVAGGLDVNGDSYGDLLVTAPAYVGVQWGDVVHGEPATFVFHGGPNGIESGGPETAEGLIDLPGIGSLVESAGDVNGDGFDDVVRPELFHLSLFFGSSSGITATEPGDISQRIFLGPMDARLNYAHTAGDVNGDGYGDLVVTGEDFADLGFAAVFHGSASGIQTGPLGEPASRLAVADDLYERLGQASGVGDINGDGYDEILVGVPGPYGGAEEGVSFLFSGGPQGVASGGAEAAVYTATSRQTSRRFGPLGFGALSTSAGDVDGDGTPDLLLGAIQFEATQAYAVPVSLAVIVLPEPAGPLALGSALVLLGWMKRRSRRLASRGGRLR